MRLLKNRMRIGRDPGLAGAEHFEFAVHRFGQQLADVPLDELGDFLRVLIGHQARGEFRVGFRGDHRLRAFAGVAAPDAVEFERRARPKPFDDRKAFFAAERGRADRLAKFLFFPGQGVQRFALGFRERGDVVVKPGNGDAEILVVKLGDHFRENRDRIRNGAAENSRVQILRRRR